MYFEDYSVIVEQDPYDMCNLIIELSDDVKKKIELDERLNKPGFRSFLTDVEKTKESFLFEMNTESMRIALKQNLEALCHNYLSGFYKDDSLLEKEEKENIGNQIFHNDMWINFPGIEL